MIYDSFKNLKDEEFYRLTGIKRELFLKMIEILNLAEKIKKFVVVEKINFQWKTDY